MHRLVLVSQVIFVASETCHFSSLWCEGMIKLVATHLDAGCGLSHVSGDIRTVVQTCLDSALHHCGVAAPARWNRADGERMRRSCMSSSPSLAEGDIWHHLACVHYGGQKELFASFSSFYCSMAQGCLWEVSWVITTQPPPTHAPSAGYSSSSLPHSHHLPALR